MRTIKKQRGFTLIEFVMVIVLMGIIASVAAGILAEGLNNLLISRKLTDANWQGQFALERMIRDIRFVRSSSDITTSTASEFAFTDINGNSIDYKLTGTSLVQGSQTLADGISGLTFTYYDKNGASGATGSAIRYVTISLNVTQNDTNYTVSTSAFLRDLSG